MPVLEYWVHEYFFLIIVHVLIFLKHRKKEILFVRFRWEDVKVLFIQFETNEKDQQSATIPLYLIS